MMPKEKLVPGGILEPCTGRAFLFFTTSFKTSDFIADGIDLWWTANQERLQAIKRLVFNLDNGPECNGHRSQFLQRMVEFVDRTRLEVRLVYYPPYHSKYNGIERYWGGLERSWNGYLLDCVETAIKRAGNFAWKSLCPTVALLEGIYAKGITLVGMQKRKLEARLVRSELLPWWDVTIRPLEVL
jgi:hypothetical protein